jgi:hypothetical protein
VSLLDQGFMLATAPMNSRRSRVNHSFRSQYTTTARDDFIIANFNAVKHEYADIRGVPRREGVEGWRRFMTARATRAVTAAPFPPVAPVAPAAPAAPASTNGLLSRAAVNAMDWKQLCTAAGARGYTRAPSTRMRDLQLYLESFIDPRL